MMHGGGVALLRPPDLLPQVIVDLVTLQNSLSDSACYSGLSSETFSSLEEDSRMHGGGVALHLPPDLLLQVIVDWTIQNSLSDSACCTRW